MTSDSSISKRIRSALGLRAGQFVYSARNLGIDSNAGKSRAYFAQSTTWHGRFRAIKPRIKRLSRLAKAGARRTSKLFTIGFRAQATFGCEVHGISDGELHRLQVDAAACMPPFAKGRSRTLALLAHGDPMAKPASAALHRWAMEVWQAAGLRDPRGFSLTQLRAVWQASSSRGQDTWRGPRGPMSVARLEAARLGWAFQGPFEILLATGDVVSLIGVSPRMVQQLAIQAHHVLLEAATNLGAITPTSNRVVLDPIMRIARAKKWLPWQSGLIRAAVTGGLWTGSRQKESGYKVDGICPLCLLADDTPFHRFFLCEACGAERDVVVDQSFLARASSAGPSSIKFERGILMHPGSDWPSPSGDEGTVFLIEGETGHEARHMEGDIYVDGACSPTLCPTCAGLDGL